MNKITSNVLLFFMVVMNSYAAENEAANLEATSVNLNVCQKDLAFAQQYFLKNDAGAQYHLNVKGQAYFDGKFEQAMGKAEEVKTVSGCKKVLAHYFKQWRKGHLRVSEMKGFFSSVLSNLVRDTFFSNKYTPSIESLTDDTLLITLPSFKYKYIKVIKDLIKENHELLVSTPKWIIDVRKNKGGSRSAYVPLLPWLLQTKPKNEESFILITEDNINIAKAECELYNSATICQERYEFLKSKPLAEFSTLVFNKKKKSQFKAELNQPKKVAILMSKRCASACEAFLLRMKESVVTTFIGQNSAGAIDTGYIVRKALPSGGLELTYSLTKSSRLPDNPIDPTGISPDIYVKKEQEKLVLSAQNWLTTGELN